MGGEGNFSRFLKALCVVERGDVAHRVVGFRDPVERSRYEVEFGPDGLARDGSDVEQTISPVAQVRRGQETGEPGASAGGGEQHGELPGGSGMFGSGDVLVHVAQRGRGVRTVNSNEPLAYGDCPVLVQCCPGCPG